MRWNEILRMAAISGTAAGASSTLALALLARSRGLSPAQPANATSHWLHGDRAARARRADLSHTGVGLLTHQAATLFWATIFEAWMGRRRVMLLPMLQHAMAMSAVAAAVDYIATPHRFTPGWELVLPKRDMAAAYVAMALGLAAGSLAARRPAGGRHAR